MRNILSATPSVAFLPMRKRRPMSPLSLTLSYAAVGATWIVVSDALADRVWSGSLLLWITHTAKGLLFIAITSLVLYRWARRYQAGAETETEALAQARARAEQSRRMYATLSAVNRRIIRPTDRVVLSQAICDALMDPGAFAAAWIGQAEPGASRVNVIAHAGAAPPRSIAIGDNADPDGRCIADVIKTGTPIRCWCEAKQGGILSQLRVAAGARACATLALRPHGTEPMVIVVYSRDPELFSSDMLTLLTELAADLEYGIEAIAEREARAAAEAALRSSEQALAGEVTRCRALLDVSVDAVQVTDLDGNLLEANEIFLRERGFTRDMMPGLRIDRWNAELSLAEIRERLAAAGSEPQLFETMHRRGDGSTFAVEARSKRVEVDGRVMIYTTTRDISERRELEHRLLRAQRLESVGLIASGIAHDLNNVLTPILLSTGLLEMRYSAREDEALLKPIEAAARRGSSIVQQILTFARGAEGQRVAIEPKVLLKELVSLIRETFPRNINHQLEIAADAWPLRGDPTQLHQVLLNLAVNARDAMPNGGTLSISVTNHRLGAEVGKHVPSARPGEFVCIKISDTGSGMTAEVLDHLFEPFFTTKPRGRGTGLGLSTVHGLVRSHGGFVDVKSRLGHGSEFSVYLPAALSPTPASDSAGPMRKQRPGRGEHILITDDEPAILSVMASLLKRNGFVPVTALDGDEALTVLTANPGKIAVVITDVMMPKFDGVRLAAEVRQRFGDIPVVAMSGMISPTSEDDSRRQLRDLGVTTVLDKPYGEAELLKAIADALRTREVMPK